MALSAVRLQEAIPSAQEREAFLLGQSQQISTLLKLSRTRPAEARLFQLLTWMGQRFGRVSRRGVSLCFEAHTGHGHQGHLPVPADRIPDQ